MNKQDIIEKLKDGNMRFYENKRIYPNQNSERVKDLEANGQRPFAVVVSCSDSRVDPAIIFDQGLGDLFVIRTAGNVLDDHAIESISYAVNNLGTKFILVLGHTKCGAVLATIEGYSKQNMSGALMETIAPAVEKAQNQCGCVEDNAIKNNAQNMVSLLKQVDFSNKTNIISGIYDLETGAVSFSD